MNVCSVLMKKCEQMSDYNFEFNSSCAPILKINVKNYFRLLSSWNYFYKTMVLILSLFLNIKTMVLYSGGSINRESPVPV